jgi:hypothetical protein
MRPGSSLSIPISTGAPATLALALGCQDLTKGTEIATAPADARKAVAALRNRLRSEKVVSNFCLPYRPMTSVQLRRYQAYTCVPRKGQASLIREKRKRGQYQITCFLLNSESV